MTEPWPRSWGHATQSVRHLHVHLIPRRDDDGLSLPWSAASPHPVQEKLEELAKWCEDEAADRDKRILGAWLDERRTELANERDAGG